MSTVPQWISALSATLANLCVELDTDENHIFRYDVVAAYPHLQEAYVAVCPRRTDLSTMRSKATNLGYVTVDPSPSEATGPTKRRGAPTVFVSTASKAIDAFAADAQLMHDNCVAFNGAGTPFAVVAADMLARCKARLLEIDAEYSNSTPVLSSANTSLSDLKPTAATSQASPSPSVPPAAPTAQPKAAARPVIRMTASSSTKAAPAVRVKDEGAPSQPARAQPAPPPPAPRQLPREAHPLHVTIPSRLRAFVIADFEQGAAKQHDHADARRWLADAAIGASATTTALEVITARFKERMSRLCTADSILRQFAANVKRLAADGNASQCAGQVLTADFAAQCDVVTNRVLRPLFNDLAMHLCLFPSERFEMAAFTSMGLIPEVGADWTRYFGAGVLLRVLLHIPSVSSAVLDKYLGADTAGSGLPLAHGTVSRCVVPVIDVLLEFMNSAPAEAIGLVLSAAASSTQA